MNRLSIATINKYMGYLLWSLKAMKFSSNTGGRKFKCLHATLFIEPALKF